MKFICLKKFIAISICALTVACAHAEQSTKADGVSLLKNKRVVFLGDSITHAGKYVSYIEYYLNKKFPAESFDIISIGLSSETTSGLSEKTHPFPRPCVHERLQRVLDLAKPNLVIACYGMNDGIYHPLNDERLEAYKKGIKTLVEKAKSSGADIILQTPPPFDPLHISNKLAKSDATDFSYRAPYAQYNDTLKTFSAWIMDSQLDIISAVDQNTQLGAYVDKRREKDPGFSFCRKDGIHPHPAGHLLMAQNFLKGIGIPIVCDDLDKELKKIYKDKLFKLVSTRRRMRSQGWLDYTGYKRRKTVKTDSVDDIERKVAELQLEINKVRANH